MANDLRVAAVLALSALLLGVSATPTGVDQPRLMQSGKVMINPDTGEIIGQTVGIDPATGRVVSVRWS